jgi:TolB-like protein
LGSLSLPAALVCALLPFAALAEPDRLPKIAVLDFQANGARPELATAATGIAAHELQRLGAFDVLTSEAIRSVLALERQKQLMGCVEGQSTCLAELAGALGVDHLVTGKISRAAGANASSFTLEMTLIQATNAKRESSELQSAATEAELLAVVGRTTAHLTSKLLGKSPGFLKLVGPEAGGLVTVDGAAVGTTPLVDRLSLFPGPHLVIVEKEGFVRFEKEVRVRPGESIEETIVLRPSADFIQQYESRASKMRLAAWSTTGLAIAGLLGAGAFQFHASLLYGDPATPGTFLYQRAKLVSGVEAEGAMNYRQSSVALQNSIQLDQILSYVSGGIGALAAAAAAYFWIGGDDPHRYQQVRLDVAVSSGSAFARLWVSF